MSIVGQTNQPTQGFFLGSQPLEIANCNYQSVAKQKMQPHVEVLGRAIGAIIIPEPGCNLVHGIYHEILQFLVTSRPLHQQTWEVLT